jgi:hypothetical protein
MCLMSGGRKSSRHAKGNRSSSDLAPETATKSTAQTTLGKARIMNLWDRGIVYSRRNGGLYIKAEWAQASAPILYAFSRQDAEADRWTGSPFQVANANHDRRRAIDLIVDYTK